MWRYRQRCPQNTGRELARKQLCRKSVLWVLQTERSTKPSGGKVRRVLVGGGLELRKEVRASPWRLLRNKVAEGMKMEGVTEGETRDRGAWF